MVTTISTLWRFGAERHRSLFWARAVHAREPAAIGAFTPIAGKTISSGLERSDSEAYLGLPSTREPAAIGAFTPIAGKTISSGLERSDRIKSHVFAGN